jgi:hypothetical protein
MFLSAPALRNACPGLVHELVLSFDRRTIRTACHAEPDAHYGVQINHLNRFKFVGLSGWPAQPYELTFTTSNATPVRSLEEALAEDTEGEAKKIPSEPNGRSGPP